MMVSRVYWKLVRPSVALTLGILAVGMLTLGMLSVGVSSVAMAQGTDEGDSQDPLVTRQTSVAQRYARLEELLLRLADVESRENPERASLLKRVAKQSREKFVLEKLRGAGDLIANGQLSKALEDQKTATSDLESLLKLLLSEDRSSRIRDEKKRIAEIIKQLRLTERNERSVRARTENGVDLAEVAREQEAIAKRAEELSKELKDQDDSPDAEGDDTAKDVKAKEAESQKAESQKAESQKAESKEEGAESKEAGAKDPNDSAGEKESSESDSADPSNPSDSAEKSSSEEAPPSESPASESQDGDSSPEKPESDQPQSAEQLAEQQLKKAIESMKKAQEKLAENKRSDATQEQRQAEEELRKAIDKLEKILRQLREEEIQRELAKLEARLRKMASMQTAILDETIQLAQTPISQRNRATDLKAGDLSFEEQKITLEADRAMLLLKEEGSSVAFPEVILQLRDDTKRVATRLGQSKIDAVTQGIQSDILAALEEMIGALAKAQRDLEKKQQEQQQGQPSGQGSQEEPLVESLAELKLIRTMQTRIQSTTDRYGNLLQGDHAGDVPVPEVQEPDSKKSVGEDILPLLRDLAQRQDRLYQITRDLVTKRNR